MCPSHPSYMWYDGKRKRRVLNSTHTDLGTTQWISGATRGAFLSSNVSVLKILDEKTTLDAFGHQYLYVLESIPCKKKGKEIFR